MNKVAGFAFLALVSAGAFAQAYVPVAPKGLVEFQGRTQVIANVGAWDLLLEGLGRTEYVDPTLQSFESLTLGGYYRLLKNFKIGAFYRLQAGAHHDDDWTHQVVTSGSAWDWNDTNTRLEHLLMLDASPRFLLDFLPGRNWVLMLKGRYIYNSFQNEMSILAQPTLTWFWVKDRVPILNVSLSYDAYFPLNFGATLIYESYPYLTVLWHATPDLGIELSGAYKTIAWSTSQDPAFAANGGLPYDPVYFSTWVVSLGVVYNLSF
ncbi:MAG: hypothetical protein ABSB63_13505 [Spirochaetia bacterium]|jgi:hypothetical protein